MKTDAMGDALRERRKVLGVLGGAALLAGVPHWAWAMFLKRFPVRSVERRDFKFDPDTNQVVDRKLGTFAYMLTLDGLVEEKVSLTYPQLLAVPSVEQVSDFHCVEGWSVRDLRWKGVRFKELLALVKPKPQASHVVFHALGRTRSRPGGLDHYVESYPIAELLKEEKQILLAYELEGGPLGWDHGAPLRLLAPFDLAYKSIKYVHRLEFADKARPGWWTATTSIYPIEAPVPPERLRKKKG